MYEPRKHHPLAWPQFLRRAVRHLLFAFCVLGGAVGLGTAGYRLAGRLPWVDAFLNASMILSGMGPVDRMTSTGAKLFSAFYALFSGLVFIAVMGVVLAPWIHRIIHWVNWEEREPKS
ncbi:MAG: hypothetical protein IT176_02130 [Acidobacteria bacterium]|nr:hypothetical protein [Acidobacteriota bacterium]